MLSEPFRVPSTAIFLSVVSYLSTAWCSRRSVIEASALSVLVGDSTRDVHGVQEDEDVRLKELHQQLQERDQDEEDPGQHADRSVLEAHLEDEVLPAQREQDQEQVAR